VSDTTKSDGFTAKFSNVRYKVIPPDKRPDPSTLSPEMRPVYDRIVAALGPRGSEYVGITKNGEPYVAGTMTQHSKDGSIKQNQPFIVFTTKTKNGVILDHAGDMAEKCSDPAGIYRAKATVLPGRENGKGGRFPNILRLSFPEKEAEYLAKRSSKTKSKDEVQSEIPF